MVGSQFSISWLVQFNNTSRAELDRPMLNPDLAIGRGRGKVLDLFMSICL